MRRGKGKKGARFSVVLHNIRSAYNVGSIFRTADAAGVEKIYLCGYTPIPETRGRRQGTDKIRKTSLGAERMVPWEYQRQTGRLLKKLKTDGACLIALEHSKNSQNVFAFKTKYPATLVVGNELLGVPQLIIKSCDAIVGIPMRGKKESLNVSVAFGIAVYAMLKS